MKGWWACSALGLPPEPGLAPLNCRGKKGTPLGTGALRQHWPGGSWAPHLLRGPQGQAAGPGRPLLSPLAPPCPLSPPGGERACPGLPLRLSFMWAGVLSVEGEGEEPRKGGLQREPGLDTMGQPGVSGYGALGWPHPALSEEMPAGRPGAEARPALSERTELLPHPTSVRLLRSGIYVC